MKEFRRVDIQFESIIVFLYYVLFKIGKILCRLNIVCAINSNCLKDTENSPCLCYRAEEACLCCQ